METNNKKSKNDDRVRKQESRYIKMVKAIFKVCRRQHVPLYSSRYSRKDITLWQHIALAALMQRINKKVIPGICGELSRYNKEASRRPGALKISHHLTTIYKFMLRVSSVMLEKV